MKNIANALKFLLPLIFLMKTTAAGHALAFTLYVGNQTAPGNDYTSIGARTGPNSVAGLPGYLNILVPANGGQGSSYSAPSVISLGLAYTVGGGTSPVNNAATFGGLSDPNAITQFTFAFQTGGHSDDADPGVSGDPYAELLVKGYATGSVGRRDGGIGFSTAKITFASIQNLSATGMQQQFAIPANNPNSGAAALYIRIIVGGQSYDLYLNQAQDIPAPGGSPVALVAYVAPATDAGATLTGQVALEGVRDLSKISGSAPLGTLHVSLRAVGSAAELHGEDVTLTTSVGSPFGTFALSHVAPGTYDIRVKGKKNLAVLISNVVVSGVSGTIGSVLLPAGDANNDNSCDTTDFGLLVGTYGSDSSVPGSGYDPAEDFNFDGVVDTTDFGLLVGEYGRQGAI